MGRSSLEPRPCHDTRVCPNGPPVPNLANFLGWFGVALSGSDSSPNVLFSSL